MTPIYKPTTKPEDWKDFLADPEKHWKTGYSAKAMAYSWKESAGIPAEIRKILEDRFKAEIEPLIIIPEYKVALPGGRRDSQNDAFLLARIGDLTAAIMVEGKVNESFGPTIKDWYKNPSEGKQKRLKFLCDKLGSSFPPPDHLRYQLFHRTASPILTALKFKTDIAIMLVHSFSQDHIWREDFDNFTTYLHAEPHASGLIRLPSKAAPPTYVGWVTGDPQYLDK